MSTAHELARRWLDTARADLMAARNCIDGPYYLPEIAAYHCQQASEKLVEAVLINRGIEPAKSHDIDALVGRLPPADSIRSVREPLGRLPLTPSLSGIRVRISTRALPNGTISRTGLPRSTP